MLEKDLIEYFECIEPSAILIERTINMSNQTKHKRIKFSKGVIAVIVAVLVLAIGVTVYATINRIFNDEKGIVSVNEATEGFVFNFEKASRKPNKYSDNKSAIVIRLNEMNHRNVLLPSKLLDESFEIYNAINNFPTEEGSYIQMKNDNYDVTINVIGKLPPSEMNSYIGTGDSRTICNVANINGIDICVCIEGDESFGYSPYIFYAVDDTLYWMNYSAGKDYDKAIESANEFIATLEN